MRRRPSPATIGSRSQRRAGGRRSRCWAPTASRTPPRPRGRCSPSCRRICDSRRTGADVSLRFAILGSGSQGNALVVEAGATRLLLDCGFAASETVRRLAALGLAPDDLSGILVTHEHDDHIGGVARFARKHGLPVWITPGTLRGLEALFDGVEVLHLIEGYAPLCIGDVEVVPFPVPHDAREPAQYVFGDGARRLGVLTDTGCVTPCIRTMLASCQALVLECNHDPALLSAGDYPLSLKQRISSRLGHLDNQAAAG